MFERRFAYRLTQWPELEPAEKTAHVLRTFSRMSVGPVTSGWFLASSRLEPAHASRLLQRLTDTGAVKQIEFAPAEERRPAQAARAAGRPLPLGVRGLMTAALVALAVVSSDESKAAGTAAVKRPQVRLAAA